MNNINELKAIAKQYEFCLLARNILENHFGGFHNFFANGGVSEDTIKAIETHVDEIQEKYKHVVWKLYSLGLTNYTCQVTREEFIEAMASNDFISSKLLLLQK